MIISMLTNHDIRKLLPHGKFIYLCVVWVFIVQEYKVFVNYATYFHSILVSYGEKSERILL